MLFCINYSDNYGSGTPNNLLFHHMVWNLNFLKMQVPPGGDAGELGFFTLNLVYDEKYQNSKLESMLIFSPDIYHREIFWNEFFSVELIISHEFGFGR